MILEAYPSLAALPKVEKLTLIRELLSSMYERNSTEQDADAFYASSQAANDLTRIFNEEKKAAIERWESFSGKPD